MSDVLFLFVMLLLLAISALCAGISNGIVSLNHYQLRHKAQLGNKDAKTVYPIFMLRYQLLVTLQLLNILANASIVVMLNQKISSILAVFFSSAFILIFGEILPMMYLRKHVIVITSRLAPLLRRVVAFFGPITRPIARALDNLVGDQKQIIYSKEELITTLDNQKDMEDTGMPSDEILMLRSVLEFGDKKIRDVMTPRRMVRVVSQEDEVGPVLMDELHKSGHSRFPVVAGDKDFSFVGTLFLRDLVVQKKLRKVSDIMSHDVLYVHEEESLDHALRAFLKTKHHLFVVVNNFEEFVGVLTIEDVLEEVIGKEIVDEFDAHDDLRQVALSIAEKEKHIRITTERSKTSKRS